MAQFGGIDVLVNNVGIQSIDSYRTAEETSEELWDRVLAVNLKSHFLMAKYCIPEIRKRGGGTIINVASVQGLQSMPKVPAYAASKGGILSLTPPDVDRLRQGGHPRAGGEPGHHRTPRCCRRRRTPPTTRTRRRRPGPRSQPLGRLGRPDDIGKAMVFLASEHAGFMTGEYVCVDGGVMAIGAWAPPVPEW